MPTKKHPRRGSMQYWPRKRAKKSLARIRSWNPGNDAKPLGFIAYKAGMVQILATDNRGKSLTKGEKIAMPVTVIDCPAMLVAGMAFYQEGKKIGSVLAEKLPKELSKKINIPKKTKKDQPEFDELRILVISQPKLSAAGTKKPKIIEVALGGKKDEQLAYAKENLGKEIKVTDIFEPGQLVDVHGITKGKGFQGTVKRYGVPIRQHKSEKVKRGIGNLGAWTPKRVQFTVPQPGKMGYHLRTEYNKQILQLGEKGEEVTPKAGFTQYGEVKNPYLLIKGSVTGARKRAVVLCKAIRPNTKMHKESFTVNNIL